MVPPTHPLLLELLSLGLPRGDFALFGSGPLLVRGWITEVGDLDVIARGDAWELAQQLGPLQWLDDHGVAVVDLGNGITIGNVWALGEFSVDDLIDEAETINGIPCVRLEHVIAYKQKANRRKDRDHLATIDAHLLRGASVASSPNDKLAAIEAYWSDQAPTFDAQPDHGLEDRHVRDAWAVRLAQWIPLGKARIVDLGCGTGSLAVLLAEAGHSVVGVDLSPAMIDQARAKARKHGVSAGFLVGDASEPDLAPASFDVVLVRHLVWTLPDPPTALRRWVRLLTDDGRLVLIEGQWRPADDTSGRPREIGIAAEKLRGVVTPLFEALDHYYLSDEAALWGRAVADERYALVARHPVRLDRAAGVNPAS